MLKQYKVKQATITNTEPRKKLELKISLIECNLVLDKHSNSLAMLSIGVSSLDLVLSQDVFHVCLCVLMGWVL